MKEKEQGTRSGHSPKVNIASRDAAERPVEHAKSSFASDESRKREDHEIFMRPITQFSLNYP